MSEHRPVRADALPGRNARFCVKYRAEEMNRHRFRAADIIWSALWSFYGSQSIILGHSGGQTGSLSLGYCGTDMIQNHHFEPKIDVHWHFNDL